MLGFFLQMKCIIVPLPGQVGSGTAIFVDLNVIHIYKYKYKYKNTPILSVAYCMVHTA